MVQEWGVGRLGRKVRGDGMLEEVQSVVVPREDITVYVGQEGREEGEILELRKSKATEHSSKRSGGEKGVNVVMFIQE